MLKQNKGVKGVISRLKFKFSLFQLFSYTLQVFFYINRIYEGLLDYAAKALETLEHE